MVVLLELGGILMIGVFAWAIWRAAKARVEDTGLRWAARIAVAAWVAFAILWAVSSKAILEDPIGTGLNVLIAMAILTVVLGYRKVLGRLKDRADR